MIVHRSWISGTRRGSPDQNIRYSAEEDIADDHSSTLDQWRGRTLRDGRRVDEVTFNDATSRMPGGYPENCFYRASSSGSMRRVVAVVVSRVARC